MWNKSKQRRSKFFTENFSFFVITLYLFILFFLFLFFLYTYIPIAINLLFYVCVLFDIIGLYASFFLWALLWNTCEQVEEAAFFFFDIIWNFFVFVKNFSLKLISWECKRNRLHNLKVRSFIIFFLFSDELDFRRLLVNIWSEWEG